MINKVSYSRETRERAERTGKALATFDVDMRHLDGPCSNRMTMQVAGDPAVIVALRAAAFAALMLHDPNWPRLREEGSYECER
jgi:hypothetical protein